MCQSGRRDARTDDENADGGAADRQTGRTDARGDGVSLNLARRERRGIDGEVRDRTVPPLTGGVAAATDAPHLVGERRGVRHRRHRPSWAPVDEQGHLLGGPVVGDAEVIPAAERADRSEDLSDGGGEPAADRLGSFDEQQSGRVPPDRQLVAA